ncbi:hypothetical protein D046_4949, partial [Vibrio parahaemolyticus V-223/04]
MTSLRKNQRRIEGLSHHFMQVSVQRMVAVGLKETARDH